MRRFFVMMAILIAGAPAASTQVLYDSGGRFDPADWSLTDATIVDGKIYVAPNQAHTARAELVGSEDWGACLSTMRVEIERSATIHMFALRDYFLLTNPQAYGQPTANDAALVCLRDGNNEGGGYGLLYADRRIEVPPNIWTIQWGALGNELVVRTWADGQDSGPFRAVALARPDLQVGPLWLRLYGNEGAVIVHDLFVEGTGTVGAEQATWGSLKAGYFGE